MLASTMQFSTNNPTTPAPTPPRDEHSMRRNTRNNQTPPPHTETTTPTPQANNTHATDTTTTTRENEALLSQDPTVCQTINPDNPHQHRFPEPPQRRKRTYSPPAGTTQAPIH